MPMPDQPIKPTAEQVLKVLADTQGKRVSGVAPFQPHALSVARIAVKILGFDPTTGKENAAFGGKTAEGWINEHLSVTTLRQVLRDLETEGTILKITKDIYRSSPEERARARLVRFGHRSKVGYVLTEAFHSASAGQDVRARNRQRRELRQEAESEVLQKYAAEVQDRYAALCEAARVNPTAEDD